MTGTADGNTSVRIFLKRPAPLFQMLATLPEVEEVQEIPVEAEEEEGKASRLLKRRKYTRGRSPAPLQRWRVVLRPQPPSGAPAEAMAQENAPAGVAQENSAEPAPKESPPAESSAGNTEGQEAQ